MKVVGLSSIDSVSLVLCGCCQQQQPDEGSTSPKRNSISTERNEIVWATKSRV